MRVVRGWGEPGKERPTTFEEVRGGQKLKGEGRRGEQE